MIMIVCSVFLNLISVSVGKSSGRSIGVGNVAGVCS